jgi:hypothetical protein
MGTETGSNARAQERAARRATVRHGRFLLQKSELRVCVSHPSIYPEVVTQSLGAVGQSPSLSCGAFVHSLRLYGIASDQEES